MPCTITDCATSPAFFPMFYLSWIYHRTCSWIMSWFTTVRTPSSIISIRYNRFTWMKYRTSSLIVSFNPTIWTSFHHLRIKLNLSCISFAWIRNRASPRIMPTLSAYWADPDFRPSSKNLLDSRAFVWCVARWATLVTKALHVYKIKKVAYISFIIISKMTIGYLLISEPR